MPNREMIIGILEKHDVGSDKFSIAPNIPANRLKNAIASFELNFFDPDDAIFFADETLLGSGKTGLMLTDSKLYVKEMMRSCLEYDLDEIESIGIKGKKLFVDDKKVIDFVNSPVSKIESLVLALREIVNLASNEDEEQEDDEIDEENDYDISSGKKISNKKPLSERASETHRMLDSLIDKITEKYDSGIEYNETLKKIDRKDKDKAISLGIVDGMQGGILASSLYFLRDGWGKTYSGWFSDPPTEENVDLAKELYSIGKYICESIDEIKEMYRNEFHVEKSDDDEAEFVI